MRDGNPLVLFFVRFLNAELRAVKVNGEYGFIQDIPQEFVEILFTGPKSIRSRDVKRDLTVKGLILPNVIVNKCLQDTHGGKIMQAKMYQRIIFMNHVS